MNPTIRAAAMVVILAAAASSIAEDVTVTTYYPSPRGVYDQLRTMNNTTLAEQGGGVGIGTTAPGAGIALAVNGDRAVLGGIGMLGAYGAGTTAVELQASTTALLGVMANNGPGQSALWLSSSPPGGAVDIASSGVNGGPTLPMTFTTNGTERMRIDTTGNVGIGTFTPQTRLDVRDGDIVAGPAGEQWIFHTRVAQNGDFLQITDQDGGGAWKWAQGLTIVQNGNVGIGTTTPNATLEVNGTVRLNNLPVAGGGAPQDGMMLTYDAATGNLEWRYPSYQ